MEKLTANVTQNNGTITRDTFDFMLENRNSNESIEKWGRDSFIPKTMVQVSDANRYARALPFLYNAAAVSCQDGKDVFIIKI